MMIKEKLPLIVGEPVRSLQFDVNDRQETTCSLDQQRVVRNYGSNFMSIGRVIPNEERIKYTWRNINATENIKKSSRLFPCNRSCKNDFRDVEDNIKHVLKDIDGVAYPEELLAIMGPSGSGKTTLLNSIMDIPMKQIKVTGTRYINGVPIDGKKIRSVVAYVQQDDLFIPNLTVKEHLIFHALVRMNRNLSYNQRITRVEEVLSELLLTNCKDTIIGSIDTGGISGGEKKRLSFAAEILTDPHLLFCDEPTSGLDSFMALQVVQAMKVMTSTGKTVICTIHQPSSELYAMFDKIMLLTEGTICFLGSKYDADSFLESMRARPPKHYNPADYFIKLISIIPEQENDCRSSINTIRSKFHGSTSGLKLKNDLSDIKLGNNIPNDWFNEENKTSYKNSCWTQFRALIWRSWLSSMKNPRLAKVRMLQTLFTSLLIGSIYFGQELNQDGVMNINGVLFIFLTNMTFQNVFAVVNVFTVELPIFVRENGKGMYRTDVYFLSKTLAELPFFIALPVIFTGVCYFMIGLYGTFPKFLVTCGIVILVANVALSYGYLVSCICSSTTSALTFAACLIIPFLLFGGYFMNLNSIPIYFRWLSYLSWFRYGNEALMINQWRDVTEIECPSNSTICPTNGHYVLQAYSFLDEHFAIDIVMLFCLIVIFRLFAFLALLKKTFN